MDWVGGYDRSWMTRYLPNERFLGKQPRALPRKAGKGGAGNGPMVMPAATFLSMSA